MVDQVQQPLNQLQKNLDQLPKKEAKQMQKAIEKIPQETLIPVETNYLDNIISLAKSFFFSLW